ncbi:hypothetical protein Tco_1074989 [Tanacetum coccineum]
MSTKYRSSRRQRRFRAGGLNDNFGGNDNLMDKGVFGNMDKNQNGGEKEFPTDTHGQMNDKDKEYYVSMLRKNEIPRKLNFKSLMTNDTGEKVVVFDVVLVSKGSERWILTACGYFVGYRMAPNELRYNIRRMWGKFGIKDIVVNNDGTCLFKFRDLEGFNYVIEKTLDDLIFARVLVEMDADIEFKKIIEVQYRDNSNKVKGTKMMNVTYDWKPTVCTHCKVFGHNFNGCLKSPGSVEEDELAKIKEEEQRIKMDKNGGDEQTRWRSYGTQQNRYKEKDNPLDTTFIKDRMVVGQFLNKNIQPNVNESSNWSQEMIRYFKEKWEANRRNENERDGYEETYV